MDEQDRQRQLLALLQRDHDDWFGKQTRSALHAFSELLEVFERFDEDRKRLWHLYYDIRSSADSYWNVWVGRVIEKLWGSGRAFCTECHQLFSQAELTYIGVFCAQYERGNARPKASWPYGLHQACYVCTPLLLRQPLEQQPDWIYDKPRYEYRFCRLKVSVETYTQAARLCAPPKNLVYKTNDERYVGRYPGKIDALRKLAVEFGMPVDLHSLLPWDSLEFGRALDVAHILSNHCCPKCGHRLPRPKHVQPLLPLS